jgi:hypothetical protein
MPEQTMKDLDAIRAGVQNERALNEQEVDYLNRFRILYPKLARSIKAELRLVPENELQQAVLDVYFKNWTELTAPRIDAVSLLDDNTALILEIKPTLTFQALAQVLAYRELFRQIFLYKGTLKMGVICSTANATNKSIAERLGISVYLV